MARAASYVAGYGPMAMAIGQDISPGNRDLGFSTSRVLLLRRGCPPTALIFLLLLRKEKGNYPPPPLGHCCGEGGTPEPY